MNHNILFRFKLSVIYLNGYPIPHRVVIRQRIGERAVKADLKVQMIAERIAGISDRAIVCPCDTVSPTLTYSFEQ